MLGPGPAKLIDFGIARSPHDEQRTATRASARSASCRPSSCMARRSRRRATSSASGVVLYEALTGRSPYPGSTPRGGERRAGRRRRPAALDVGRWRARSLERRDPPGAAARSGSRSTAPMRWPRPRRGAACWPRSRVPRWTTTTRVVPVPRHGPSPRPGYVPPPAATGAAPAPRARPPGPGAAAPPLGRRRDCARDAGRPRGGGAGRRPRRRARSSNLGRDGAPPSVRRRPSPRSVHGRPPCSSPRRSASRRRTRIAAAEEAGLDWTCAATRTRTSPRASSTRSRPRARRSQRAARSRCTRRDRRLPLAYSRRSHQPRKEHPEHARARRSATPPPASRPMSWPSRSTATTPSRRRSRRARHRLGRRDPRRSSGASSTRSSTPPRSSKPETCRPAGSSSSTPARAAVVRCAPAGSRSGRHAPAERPRRVRTLALWLRDGEGRRRVGGGGGRGGGGHLPADR